MWAKLKADAVGASTLDMATVDEDDRGGLWPVGKLLLSVVRIVFASIFVIILFLNLVLWVVSRPVVSVLGDEWTEKIANFFGLDDEG